MPVIYVWCDFDGTISINDIGDEIFKEFGDFDELNSMLRAGDINISQYWKRICGTLPTNLSIKEISDFACQFEIDKYFRNFADYCNDNGINIRIISDGFDIYIKPVLAKYNLDWIELYSNRLEKNQSGQFEPVFMNASESCSCECASCKRNIMLSNTPHDALIAYIGDGFSDFCVAKHSDIIFGKKKLAKYCNEHRISHFSFSNFFDILTIFEKKDKRKFRISRNASHLRKKAFEIE